MESILYYDIFKHNPFPEDYLHFKTPSSNTRYPCVFQLCIFPSLNNSYFLKVKTITIIPLYYNTPNANINIQKFKLWYEKDGLTVLTSKVALET